MHLLDLYTPEFNEPESIHKHEQDVYQLYGEGLSNCHCQLILPLTNSQSHFQQTSHNYILQALRHSGGARNSSLFTLNTKDSSLQKPTQAKSHRTPRGRLQVVNLSTLQQFYCKVTTILFTLQSFWL